MSLQKTKMHLPKLKDHLYPHNLPSFSQRLKSRAHRLQRDPLLLSNRPTIHSKSRNNKENNLTQQILMIHLKQNPNADQSINDSLINQHTMIKFVKGANKSGNIIKRLQQQQKKYSKIEKEKWFEEHGKFNHEGFSESTQITIRYDGLKSKQAHQFLETCSIQEQSLNCIDGCFPRARNFSCLASFAEDSHNYSLFLLGGLSPEIGHRLHFHQYDKQTKNWIPIQSQDPNAPRFNLSQHCVNEYKKRLFLIGGIAIFPSKKQIHKNQRYYIPFISVYSVQKNEWNRINWNVYIRGHACCSFKNYLLIDGGINQNQKHNCKSYIMNMDETNSPQQIEQFSNLKLSFHKIVSTQQIDYSIRSKIKYEGLFCFGGKFKNNKINGHLYFCQMDSKFMDTTEKRPIKIEWKKVTVHGQSPTPRYSHSMNILNIKGQNFQKRSYIIVIGGKDSYDQILNDFWGFDLGNQQWSQVMLPENSAMAKQGISEHTSVSIENQIFIFGGTNKWLQIITNFWSLNFGMNKKKDRLLTKKYNRSIDLEEVSKKYINFDY